MDVIKSIEINITVDEVLKAQHRGGEAAPQIKAATQKAISMSTPLLRPATLITWVDVGGNRKGDIDIVSKEDRHLTTTLHLGAHADLLAKAKMAMVVLHTIGNELDEKVHRLNKAGDTLTGYLLDSVGVVALAKVGEHARHLIESKAGEKGWGVGASLSPGSLIGWDISGQADICSILDMAKIGVELNDSGLLIPFKSVTSIVGMGPAYSSRKVGSICRYCSHAPTCWRRRKDPVEA